VRRPRIPAKLPSVHLSLPREVRLPRIGRPRLRRPQFRPLTFERLQAASDPVGFFFYVLMFAAVLAFFAGASASGLLMLFTGASLHVFRSSVEELAAKRRREAEHAARKREVRLRSHRIAQRRVSEAKATPLPASSPEFRVSAAARAPRERRRVSVR
jgi:hypothetical protein